MYAENVPAPFSRMSSQGATMGSMGEAGSCSLEMATAERQACKLPCNASLRWGRAAWPWSAEAPSVRAAASPPLPLTLLPIGPRKVAPGKVRRKRGSRGMAELVALQQ